MGTNLSSQGQRKRREGTAMATDAQLRLFEAVKAHTYELESKNGASGIECLVLDQRLKAARQTLEWPSAALESGYPRTRE